MRTAHHALCVSLCIIGVIAFMLTSPALAQGQQAILVGRAVLPAGILADGPKAALAWNKPINGIKLPFDSQPVGNFSASLPGDYADAWLALSDGQFDNAQHSNDFRLRVYTINVSWRDASGGEGTANLDTLLTLSDPASKAGKKIQNNDQPRELTGADFQPAGLGRAADGSLWVAESIGPSLLHFDKNGHLLTAPIKLEGAGELQGMSELQDRKTLVIAQRSASNKAAIVLRAFDTDKHALGAQVGSFNLNGAASSASGLTMINDHQALVVEQDSAENKAAKFKQIFLADLNPASQTPVADLLNIADPNAISTANVFQPQANTFGLGTTFKFPYADVSAIYPIDPQTLLVVNNNHLPFGLGRSATHADDTEYIAIHINQALNLSQAFPVPH